MKEWTARHGVLELIDGAIDCGLEGGDACSFAISAVAGIVCISIVVVSLTGIEAMLFWEGVIVVFTVGVGVVVILGGGGGVVDAAAMLRLLLLLLLLLQKTHDDDITDIAWVDASRQ